MTNQDTQTAALQAAELIAQAGGLIIGAGAGIGVDSGLPDFGGYAAFDSSPPAIMVVVPPAKMIV